MKKTLIALLAAGASFAAFGQGKIQLDNLLSTGLVPIKLAGGDTAIGDKFKVEVWSGANLVGAGAFYPNLTGARAGRFNIGAFEVAGTAPGASAKLTVRAWDSTTGATYADATVKGASAEFNTSPLGGPNPAGGPDILLPKLDGLQSFSLSGGGTVIPEPSTIALAALGAAALVCRRRK